MDVEILSRIQFAFTCFFHYLFPPMSIGLGLLLVMMEGAWLKTGNEMYKRMAHFWVKVFALIFGIGVASGIVLEFQFGTNWATYSRFVGDIFGSALAAEGVFAFFLESGFLAVLVFGWHKVSPKWHFFSTCMVALGSTFSAVWIIVANSWMQTPAGYHIVGEGANRRAEITDFWAMVFNPSSMDRLGHTVSGCWITGALFVTSVSAFYLLKKKHEDIARTGMKMGLGLALVACALQIYSGHHSAGNVAKNQPAKFAAYEGHFKANGPADLVIVGVPNADGTDLNGLKIPGGASMLLAGDPTYPVQGLDSMAKEDQPPVMPTFWFYRIMLGAGLAIFAIVVTAAVMWRRGTLWTSKPMLMTLVGAAALPHIANQAGWFAAEVGRQPWLVTGMLRTKDGLSKSVTAPMVATSLVMFILIYGLLTYLFFYLLNKRIQEGPEQPEWPEVPDPGADQLAASTKEEGHAYVS